jgi:hypothetical protein
MINVAEPGTVVQEAPAKMTQKPRIAADPIAIYLIDRS